jgi:hypothetical protein
MHTNSNNNPTENKWEPTTTRTHASDSLEQLFRGELSGDLRFFVVKAPPWIFDCRPPSRNDQHGKSDEVGGDWTTNLARDPLWSVVG